MSDVRSRACAGINRPLALARRGLLPRLPCSARWGAGLAGVLLAADDAGLGFELLLGELRRLPGEGDRASSPLCGPIPPAPCTTRSSKRFVSLLSHSCDCAGS